MTQAKPLNCIAMPILGGYMAWLVCLSAGLFFFYEFIQLNMFDAINNDLRHYFALNRAQFSWLSSTFLWANMLFLIPAGILLDRFSIKRVMIIAMLVCIVGTFGLGFSHSLIIAYICRFLTGIGNAFGFLACAVLISRWFPSTKQAFVIGCVVTMAFIGGMVAHTPLTYLTHYVGWQNTLLIDSLIGGVFLIWIHLFVQNSPIKADMNITRNRTTAINTTLKNSIYNPQNWLAGLYTSCLNLSIMVLGALWGKSLLESLFKLNAIEASNVVGFIFLGSILGCPLFGWLSDTLGKRKPIMFLGAICTLVIFFLLLYSQSLSVVTLTSIFFGIGFFSSTQVISYPLIAESNAPSLTGAATSIASIIIMGGGALGQIIFGQILEISNFQYALWLFPITLIFSIFTLLFIKETHCNPLN